MTERDFATLAIRSKKLRVIAAMLCAICIVAGLMGCSSKSSSSNGTSSVRSTTSSQASSNAQSQGATLPDLSFQTKDINGNAVSIADFTNAKLILVNLWEPWCGPCVAEIPSLQSLYERYRDDGLVIIGAYSTTSQKDDILSLIEEDGITYPIVYANNGFTPYKTRYVPTSMLFDGQGRPLIDEPLVGAQTYDEWEELILRYL